MNSKYNPEHLDKILHFLVQPQFAGQNHQTSVEILENRLFQGRVKRSSIKAYVNYLDAEGYVRKTSTQDGPIIKLLPEGAHFFNQGGFSELSKEFEEKEAKRKELIEKQLLDLDNRISTQKEQLDFWVKTAEANEKKAKIAWPSFWISVGSLAVAIIALAKSCN